MSEPIDLNKHRKELMRAHQIIDKMLENAEFPILILYPEYTLEELAAVLQVPEKYRALFAEKYREKFYN